MGGTGGARGAHAPPAEVCVPRVPPIYNFEKIGPHLRLQDAKCSSIDMPFP